MPTLSERLMPHLRRAALARDSAPLTDGQLLGAFVADRDPVAFEALVRRHGPMVFGVCRRVIGHAHTAEDAVQAVFVVLARKAGAVKPREQLANWLFGVAYRTALKARGLLHRRWSREKQVDVMPDAPVSAADLWADIQPVLDLELAALPDRLRLPVVLCDLEGRTQREAARQLNVPPATLANRLTAARRRLAERLTARGVTLSGGLLATVLSENVGRAAVPAGVCAAAAKAGLSAVGAAAGAVPDSVLQLSDGVLRIMMLSKLKAVTAVALAGLMLLGGLGLGTLPLAFAQGPPAPAAKPALGPNLSDAEFLKKTCEALRGTPATAAELGYFVADADANKRKKVVTWLTEPAPSAVDRYIHSRLERLNTPDVADPDIAVRRLSLDLTGTPDGAKVHPPADRITVRGPGAIAFSPDGRKLAVAAEADIILLWSDADDDEPTKEERRINRFLLDMKDVKPKSDELEIRYSQAKTPGDTDADFLNKATAEARGSAPTKLEREYFLADKDSKKREKLLDLLLSDPAVAKKVGPEWKQAMLNPPTKMVIRLTTLGGPDWSKLIGELQAAKKTDEQILESLTLAIAGRLPTDTEKKLVAGMVAKEKDKKAAWAGVAGTLASTDEAKKHAEKLKPGDQIRYRALVAPLELDVQVDPVRKPPLPQMKVIPLPKSPEPKK
jgi:RNA polymerase sigma factor (sigma-70 family)